MLPNASILFVVPGYIYSVTVLFSSFFQSNRYDFRAVEEPKTQIAVSDSPAYDQVLLTESVKPAVVFGENVLSGE